MANPMKGEAAVTLADGRALTFAYDFDALCAAEDAADKPISQMLAGFAKGDVRLGTARALIYGGLRRHHPEMGLAGAGELLMSDPQAVTGAMQKALAAAFPQAKEGGEESHPPRPRRGTGAPTSVRGRKRA